MGNQRKFVGMEMWCGIWFVFWKGRSGTSLYEGLNEISYEAIGTEKKIKSEQRDGW